MMKLNATKALMYRLNHNQGIAELMLMAVMSDRYCSSIALEYYVMSVVLLITMSVRVGFGWAGLRASLGRLVSCWIWFGFWLCHKTRRHTVLI